MSSTKLVLELGVLDLQSGAIGGTSIRLTKTERRLVAFLAEADRAVSPEELLTEVWGYREGVRSRTVYSTVNRVRRKIERDAAAPVHLVNDEPGYRFQPFRTRQPGPPLLGRADAVEEVLQALEDGPVAIIGPGGIGKTTLARHITAVRSRAPLLWVDLRDVTTVAEARGRIAERLGLEGDDIEEALELRGALLLVLDDLDVLADASQLVDALAGIERSSVLCTCRSAVPGCRSVALEPLEREAARELLTRRSERSFPVEELDALGDELGRSPLALCLASEWLDALGTRVFAADPLRLPGLRGSIERSWERLSPPARHLLAGIASVGSQAPVELVLHLGDLDALAELTRLALVVASDGWIELSGPVRAFAAEAPRRDDLLERAGTWVRSTSAEARAALFTVGLPGRLRRFRRCRPLLLAITDRLPLEEQAPILVDVVEVALHFGGAVRSLEGRVTRALEGVSGVVGTALELQLARLRLRLAGRLEQPVLQLEAASLPSTLRARYGHYRCSVALQHGELDEALDWVQQELRATDRTSVIHRRLVFCRAKIHRRRGELDEALDWVQELDLLSIEADDPVHRMTVEALRGSIAKQQRRFEAARSSLSQARERAASLELHANHAHLSVALAQILFEVGEVAQARTLLAGAEAHYLETGQRRSLGYVQLTLASSALAQRDARLALDAGRSAIRHLRRSEDHVGLRWVQILMARSLVVFERPDEAEQLLVELLESESGPDRVVLDALLVLSRRVQGEKGLTLPPSLQDHAAGPDVSGLIDGPVDGVRDWLASPAFEKALGIT